MLDMKWIRSNKQKVQLAADQKGITLSVEQLVQLEDQKRQLQQEADELRRTRNSLSQDIGKLMHQGGKLEVVAGAQRQNSERQLELLIETKKQAVKASNEQLIVLQHQLAEIEVQAEELMLLVPNIVSPDTPIGRSDADNVAIKHVGEPIVPEFVLRDHMQLGDLHQIFDIPRGVKTAGSRSYYLKGAGAQLHRAVQQMAIDLLASRGFTLLEVPLMVRTEALTRSAFFPLGRDQTYRIDEEDRWLVGTSEVPLISYYSNEIIDLAEPMKLMAASQCFRSEVGSAGRDVHGLYRVHQFAKVEQVVLCEADPEVSELLLQEITANAEHLLQLLELPYRVMAVCTGDMSQKTYKQYDIETWMPSRQAYGETHSSSNLHDFQARRSNIRYRDETGQLRYCHTLNNTAVATPRILIPLLENHQQEDGSIRIPKALQPYMNGKTLLAP